MKFALLSLCAIALSCAVDRVDAAVGSGVQPRCENAAAALQTVRSDPGGDTAFRAIVLVLRACGGESRELSEHDAAIHREMSRYLLEHHVNRQDLLATAVRVRYADRRQHALFWNEVFEKTTHRMLKAVAAQQLASDYAELMGDARFDYAESLDFRHQAERWANLLLNEYPDNPYAQKNARSILELLRFSVGASLPALEGETVSGRRDDLKNYRGRFVLIELWATWCGPCLADRPRLVRLEQILPQDRFAIIAISVNDRVADVLDYLKRASGGSWIEWHDADARQKLGASGLPAYILADGKGVIRLRTGALTDEAIARIERIVRS